MKKLFLLFLIIISLNCLAQFKNGTVKYNLIIGFDEGFSKAEALKATYNKAIEGAKKMTFSLKFNENESLFQMENIIIDQSSGVSSAIAFTSADEIIYNSKSNYETITQSDSYLGLYLITEVKKTNWILTQESKVIDGYTCNKATSSLLVKNNVGTFKHPVVAWYCPQIPVNFGPKGYSGLPGLILELQERSFTYGLKTIVFNKELKIIEKPNKGKLVTSEEFENIITQKFKD